MHVSAARLAHKTLVEPDPARRSPSPVMSSPMGMVPIKTNMGRNMLMARGGVSSSSISSEAVEAPSSLCA